MNGLYDKKPHNKKLSPPSGIFAALEAAYGGMSPALNYRNPFELLIAVMLSAQTNDAQVNKATVALFRDFPAAPDLSLAETEKVEQYIKTCGLYRGKARNIIAASRIIVRDYGGIVPHSRAALEALPGVGRKTASVVLFAGFGIPALPVDTHVFRVARRLGLSEGKNPAAVEDDLCKALPPDKWGEAHHWLIWHGRKVCAARKPACPRCFLAEICPSAPLLSFT